MPLLNYTTKVGVGQTISEIQRQLVNAGARTIVIEYDDNGAASGISFVIGTVGGQRGFTLPVHTDNVLKVLERQYERNARVDARPEHAARVAWRIVKDWLEAQLAIIETEMVTLDQVMLPYMRTGDGRTMYELYCAQQLALPSGDAV